MTTQTQIDLAAIKTFKALSVKFGRVVNSAAYKQWENYEAECRDGWFGQRSFPYRGSFGRAAERADVLQEQASELFEAANEATQLEIGNNDPHFMVTC